MSPRQRHHVISRGYQRLFAYGERVAICSRTTFETKLVGTRDAFVRKHFSSYEALGDRVDALEDEWSRVESLILPDVRALVNGQETIDLRDSAKVLAAIHWGRSYSFDRALRTIVEESRHSETARIASEPDVRQAFKREIGRLPHPGEIEAVVDGRFDEVFGPTGSFRIERMANAHNQALQKLMPLQVQILRPATERIPFIFGDTPVVHFSKLKAGWRSRLALGDADHIYLPLAPTLAVMFTTRLEDDQRLSPWLVQRMNDLVWRVSWKFIAGAPSTDFLRATARGSKT